MVSFGGAPNDYLHIHKFLDSSKFYCFHVKHRALLHNTFGMELCTRLFGDTIENSDGEPIVVRDIAAQHLKEDLSGWVPTLYNWFKDQEAVGDAITTIPESDDAQLQEFIHLPYLQSGLKTSYLITCTDFGVDLAKVLLGVEKAKILRALIPPEQNIQNLLQLLRFTDPWQYTPKMSELEKLK